MVGKSRGRAQRSRGDNGATKGSLRLGHNILQANLKQMGEIAKQVQQKNSAGKEKLLLSLKTMQQELEALRDHVNPSTFRADLMHVVKRFTEFKAIWRRQRSSAVTKAPNEFPDDVNAGGYAQAPVAEQAEVQPPLLAGVNNLCVDAWVSRLATYIQQHQPNPKNPKGKTLRLFYRPTQDPANQILAALVLMAIALQQSPEGYDPRSESRRVGLSFEGFFRKYLQSNHIQIDEGHLSKIDFEEIERERWHVVLEQSISTKNRVTLADVCKHNKDLKQVIVKVPKGVLPDDVRASLALEGDQPHVHIGRIKG